MTIKLPHLLLAILILNFVSCATSPHSETWRRGTTTINASGSPGSNITGFYFQDGQRHDIADTLPFTLTATGVSEVEVRKVNRNEALMVAVRYDDPERHVSFANMVAAPGVPGVRVQFRNGFVVENLKK
jgi:hypothetical protein